MLVKILGWFWIGMGILFLLKPELLRKRLQKKSFKKFKKYLFSFLLVLSGLLIAAAWRAEGLLAKVVMIFGIMGIFKAFFFLKAKGAEKFMEWFADKPLILFRFGATFHIVLGTIILALRK